MGKDCFLARLKFSDKRDLFPGKILVFSQQKPSNQTQKTPPPPPPTTNTTAKQNKTKAKAKQKKKPNKPTMLSNKDVFGSNQSNAADEPKFLLSYQLW